jgi:ABC-2 type transport system ATP-binding protein
MSIPAPGRTVVRVKGLRRSFGGRRAVDSVSFELARGEVLGLLGPNGAGKSTTLHLLAGVLLPDAGRIDFANGLHGAARRARVGLAPQSLALYKELGVEDNLRFFGGLYGLAGTLLAERIEWALAWVGLASRRGDRTGTLSGGMQRRLNLACAALHWPDLLLLDEPTAGIDAASRELVFESLLRLRERGTAIVLSTHLADDAPRLCDRVARFEHGRIVAIEVVVRAAAVARPAPARSAGNGSALPSASSEAG